jgi:methylenetetrahydrofolate reductase (NADPH)
MTDGLEGRIASFVRGASTEIAPSEQSRLSDLQSILPAGTAVYVAHTPNADFGQVIQTALAVQRAGFQARPHIAVRRIQNPKCLRAALAELRAGGVEHILLIAGDAPQPIGEFRSTLDVFASGILEESGIRQIGVAGHPEGHNEVASGLLWEALHAKQAIAARASFDLDIVTQFGLDGGAFRSWESELVRRGIQIPVRIGIAGPAPLAKLVHFAVQSGIGTSMRSLVGNLRVAAQASDLLTSPDRHLLRLMGRPLSAQIVAPHFFAFGGVLQTARWMEKVAAGSFDIDPKCGRFRVR